MHNLHFVLIAVLNLAIGSFILSRGKTRPTHQAFFMACACTFFWVMALYGVSNVHSLDAMVLFCRLSFVAGMLVPAAILHMVEVFPGKNLRSPVGLGIYLPAAAVSLLCLTPAVVKTCELHPWGVKAIPGPMYPAVLAYFSIYIGLIVTAIARGYRHADRYQKNQWLYVILGLPVPVIFVVVTNLILPRLGFKDVYTLGPWASFGMFPVIGYAIYKYHLFDIHIIFKKATVNVFLLIVIGGVSYFVYLLSGSLIGGYFKNHELWLFGGITLAMVFFLNPLQRLFDRGFERLFPSNKGELIGLYEQLFNWHELLQDLMVYLADCLASILVKLNFQRAAVYISEENTRDYLCLMKKGEGSQELPDFIKSNDPVLAWVRENHDYLDKDEFAHTYGHLFLYDQQDEAKSAVYQGLTDLKAKLIFPVIVNKMFVGIFMLSAKIQDELVSSQEIAFLKAFANQVGMAILNKKIATQNLHADRMRLVGTISASLAHEIRNPLTSIRSLIEILPATANKQNVIDKIMEMVPGEIDRITKILNELAAFSHATPGVQTEVYLSCLINNALFLLDEEIRQRHLAVEESVSEQLAVFADADQIKQVFMNVLLNACQASKPHGTITIRAEERHGQVGVTIKDQGEGIPANQLVAIFEPFFSTKVYGTGLGLSTSKRIVEEHGGRILVESEPGKGSAFIIQLPLWQG